MRQPAGLAHPSLRGLAYGGDYNPDQWPEGVWAEDARLMREAGVSLVTVGVFSWARIEPQRGVRDLGWLDRVLDLMHAHDIAVDLATATASPPAWLAAAHPDVLPVDARGTRLSYGSRQTWCPSSAVYRAHSLALVEHLAERYAQHPALALWHVSNELGCHNVHCYCDASAAAFRSWLRRRYGDLDRLNAAWGTAFWSQRYGTWEEVLPPRATTAIANPTQQLDFARFSSDEVLGQHLAEREVLRRVTPDVPVTTNFMVMEHQKYMDYWRWAPHQDVVSTDHYLDGRLADPHVELSFCADWVRGLAGGAPWLLMEHSTSAVNWQPRNYAKAPGQLRRNSLQHVARGADFVGFFQWRASVSGAEKYHSGMLPHAGTDSALWREVVELGATLRALEEVAGTRVAPADVCFLLDYEAWWAVEQDAHPSQDVRYLDAAHRWYRAFWEAGVTVDVRHPSQPLDGYALVVLPMLHLVSDADAERVREFVAAGGQVLVTYLSGTVDPDDHVRTGGYPGAFRDVLGVRVEQFHPLPPGEAVRLSDGGTCDQWVEELHLTGAAAFATYVDGPLPGVPAVTRYEYGLGVGWYAATRLDGAGTAQLVERLVESTGAARSWAPAGVEVVRRVREGASYAFVLNHTPDEVQVELTGVDLVGGGQCGGTLTVGPGGVACVRESTSRQADSQEAR